MPLHDWTRVIAGTYHAFHNSWITHIQEALNGGLLPKPHYALGEQRAGNTGPSVLALHEANGEHGLTPSESGTNGMVAVAEAPPRVQSAIEARLEAAFHMAKRRTLVIRHASGDRIVALIEITSLANKHTYAAVNDFVDKVVAALNEGIHVMVIDSFPPGKHDPQGMHAAIWEGLGEPIVAPPADRPLTLVSYCAKSPITAYL